MTEPELDDFYAWHRTPKNIRPTWSNAKGYWRSYKDDEITPTSIAIINPPMGQKYWDVRSIVGSFGPIRDIYQPRHFGSNKPRGVIFVEMVNAEDARVLVEETNVFYDGESVRIDYAGLRGRPADFIGRAVAKAVADAGGSTTQPIVVNINYGQKPDHKPAHRGNTKRYNFNVGAEEWTPALTTPPSTPVLNAVAEPKTPEPKPIASQPPPAPVKRRLSPEGSLLGSGPRLLTPEGSLLGSGPRCLPPGLDIISSSAAAAQHQRFAAGPSDGPGFTLRSRRPWNSALGLEGDTIWPADPTYTSSCIHNA